MAAENPTKIARAWVNLNLAALLRIAMEEDHRWLIHDVDGKPLDEHARRRVQRVARDFVRKHGG